jgi:hypothetical protein
MTKAVMMTMASRYLETCTSPTISDPTIGSGTGI